MKRILAMLAVAALLGGTRYAGAATGPVIDWDPAYTWEPLATATNSVAGQEFRLVGTVSGFDGPLGFLNPTDPTREYTFVAYGLISQGTTSVGPPAFTIYTTNYTGGTFELYEDLSPDAVFAANPPNAQVPSTFGDGTLLLSGSFTSFQVVSNNFTSFNTGNIEGNISWTGGSLIALMNPGGQPCPGLFTGGSTWFPGVMIPGYIYRHDGKIDMQCPVSASSSTWGRIKSLYR